MSEIQSLTKKEAKYTIRVNYMPDGAVVQSVMIWNEGMSSQELGEVITILDSEYRPLKMIIINDQQDEDAKSI